MFKFLKYFGKIKKDIVKPQFLEKKLSLYSKKSFNFSEIYNIKNRILLYLDNDDNVNFTSLLFLASIKKFYTGEIIAISPIQTDLKKFNIFDKIFLYSTKNIEKYPKKFTNYIKRVKSINSTISIIINSNPNLYEKYLISQTNSSIIIGTKDVNQFVNFSISFNRDYYYGEFFLKILEKLNIPSVRKDYFDSFLNNTNDTSKNFIAISASLLEDKTDLNNLAVQFENRFPNSIFMVIYANENEKKIPIFNKKFTNLYSKDYFYQLYQLSRCDKFITNHNTLFHIFPIINNNKIILIDDNVQKHLVYQSSNMSQYENLNDFLNT